MGNESLRWPRGCGRPAPCPGQACSKEHYPGVPNVDPPRAQHHVREFSGRVTPGAASRHCNK
eukprot:14996080-Alexandrium_andersonii.AAC.1